MSLWRSFFSFSGPTRSQDQLETQRLYDRVHRKYVGSRYEGEEKLKEYRLQLFYRFEEKIPLGLRAAFYDPYVWLLMSEDIIFDMPKLREGLTLEQEVELREALRRKEIFQLNEAQTVSVLEEGIERIFTYVGEQLPDVEESSPFTIPLVFALPNPKETMRGLIGELWQRQYQDAVLFVPVTRQLHSNLCAASGITDPQNPNKPFVLPTESKAPLSEIVDTYFADTPFHALFTIDVPLKLTHEDRHQHCHIVGGSGAGKTQLLQSLILHDIQSADAPSLVIVDSQGDLIDKVSHIAAIKDRIILITPKDINHPPALNIFDLDRGRLRGYDALKKEQVTAGAIETFDYLFTGLLGADLTAKQGVFFRYVARLMLSLPETLGRNATILDMIRLMDDIEPYQPAIAKLPEIQRQFFERDFAAKTFEQTKEQIRYRLQGIIENPTIAKLFTSPTTKIDLFTALNEGKIILVDTAKDFLKGSSSHFGRIFISLVLQAALERAADPESERRNAYLVVDEAAEYFDQNIDDLLTEVRKYKLGCIFAHQHLEQCTPQLRASFAANTGIKMASGVSSSDARSMAQDMRTTADFILAQPRLTFACHIRGVTPQAVAIPIEVGKLEREPRLTEEQYEEMRARNRKRVAIDPQSAQKRTAESPQDAPKEEAQHEEPAPIPRSKRPRPKKNQKKKLEPLTGDIDTSA